MTVTGASVLVDAHDAVLFDLDGVIYLGPVPVPEAPRTCAELHARGTGIGFVTNNAARTPDTVAEHLRELGIAASASDVVTSAQAVASLVAGQVPPGSPVLVLGAPALVDELVGAAGIRPVRTAAENPVAVVQGLAPSMTWDDLCEAAAAIHRGARWFAANLDTTRPTDRGEMPGCGAAVQALRLAVDIDPVVAGKPYPPLMRAALERLGSKRAIFVGDRVDTDIAGAVAVGIDSMLVLSGAHGLPELLTADATCRPTHIGADVSALLAPARQAEWRDGTVRCGDATARVVDGKLEVTGRHDTADDWLDAAWTAATAVWHARDQGQPVDTAAAVAALGALPAVDPSRTVGVPAQ